MDKLREQLAALLITRQVIGNIRESFIPFIMEQFKLARMVHHKYGLEEEFDNDAKSVAKNDSGSEVEMSENEENTLAKGMEENQNQQKINLSQAEVEGAMYKYDGTFEDYLEMFIQFGYVILFSSAFPMAAMCALLNNIVEIRSDAFKLCCIFQRPFGQRAENIGSWQAAMEVMCIIAVMVNSALIGMSGQVHRMFPDLSTAGTIILIVFLEHLTFTLKMILYHSIPSVPFWVASEMAKIEYNRREAAKKLIRTHSGTSLMLRSSPPIAKMNYSGGCNVGCQTDNLLGKNSIAATDDLQRTWSGKQPRKFSKFRLYDRLKRGRKRKVLGNETEKSQLSEPLHKLTDSVGFFFDSDYEKGSNKAEDSDDVEDVSSNSSNYEVPVSDMSELLPDESKNVVKKLTEDLTMQEPDHLVPTDNSSNKSSPSNTRVNTKRFSPPTFKLKSFRRFSTEGQGSESPQKTWNFGKLSFLRKSLTSKNLHKSDSKEGTTESEDSKE